MPDGMIGPVTILRDPKRGGGYAATCPCGWWTGWALGLGKTAGSARNHAQICAEGRRHVSWSTRQANHA